MRDGQDYGETGIGEIFRGLGKIIDAVLDVAKKGINEKNITGEFFNTDQENGLRGRYDFSVRTGLNEISAGEIAEPKVDIFNEDGKTVVIAEMPGVRQEDFEYETLGDSLIIKGKGKLKNYIKRLKIENMNSETDAVTLIENNGVYMLIIKHKEG